MNNLVEDLNKSTKTPKIGEIPKVYREFFDRLEGRFDSEDDPFEHLKTRKENPRKVCDYAYFMAIDAEWFESAGRNVVLSYQVATATRDCTANVIKYARNGERMSLSEIAELGIKSVNGGKIPDHLKGKKTRIVLISHNISAEWSVLADRDEPHVTKRLALVRKSPITDGHAIKLTLEKRFPVDVVFYDTMLLSPATHRSLAKLSKLLGDEDESKVKIKQAEIERMDLFLSNDPERFEEYALRDSEACLRLFFVLQESLNNLAFGRFKKLFRTLASAGVKGFLDCDAGNWFLDYLEWLGLRPYNIKDKKAEDKKFTGNKFRDPYRLVKRAYHGGRNESYLRGRTESFAETDNRVWIDIDLSSAYPSAMALCPKIDVYGEVKHLPLRYEITGKVAAQMTEEGIAPNLINGAREALDKSVEDFDRYLSDVKPRKRAKLIRDYATVIDNSLIKRWQKLSRQSSRWMPESYLIPGFARVRFEFDETVTYPCLPVRHYRYGLLYPSAGETVATSAEILLAMECGAKIEALTSVEMPVIEKDDVEQPDCFFQSHLSNLLKQRAQHKRKAKSDKSSEIYERLIKEFVNSFYGKFSQSINPKNVFRPATGEMVGLGSSELTEPCVAALTTGLVRAVLSSLLIGIDQRNQNKRFQGQAPVVSATTDGILFGVPRPKYFDLEAEYFTAVDGVPLLKAEIIDDLEIKKAIGVEALFARFGCEDMLERFASFLPVRQLIYSRRKLTGQPDYLEVKHLVDEVISVKTRGQIGRLNSGHVPLLARFGHKPPLSELIDDKEEYKRIMDAGGTIRNNEDAEWLIEQLDRIDHGRDKIDSYTFITLTPFRKMLESEGKLDLTKQVRQQKVNTDFDWKRKIVSADSPLTVPFKDVAEMVTYRRQAEGLRRSGRVARTEQVLHRVELKQRKFRYRDGEASTLVRSFMRGVAQGHISVQNKKMSYPKMAEQIDLAWHICDATSKSNKWTADDFKNAKRALWEPGTLLPTLSSTTLLQKLCEHLMVDYDKAHELIFVSSEYRDENIGLVKAVVRSILLAPRAGFEPFRTLFLDGKLPSRPELLATFRPVLTDVHLGECAYGRFEPGTRFPGDREKLTQLFRRCGLPTKEAQKCARLLAPPSPKRSKSRRNPAQVRCLENFVMALQLRDINVTPLKSVLVLDRLSRFGLTRRRYYAVNEGKFTPKSLTNTPENCKQIEKMAKALRVDPIPFINVLLDH